MSVVKDKSKVSFSRVGIGNDGSEYLQSGGWDRVQLSPLLPVLASWGPPFGLGGLRGG